MEKMCQNCKHYAAVIPAMDGEPGFGDCNYPKTSLPLAYQGMAQSEAECVKENASGCSCWSAAAGFEPEHVKQARAQMASIDELVEAFIAAEDADDEEAKEAAERAIAEDALSVEIRNGWRIVGGDDDGPDEYRICLCTGGPAVQIVGELNEYYMPKTARLQAQDWSIPWENVSVSEDEHAALLGYARNFYYEG